MQFADDDSDEIAEKVEKLYETVKNATPNQRSISENILQPFLSRDNSMKKRTQSTAPNRQSDLLAARKSDAMPQSDEPIVTHANSNLLNPARINDTTQDPLK